MSDPKRKDAMVLNDRVEFLILEKTEPIQKPVKETTNDRANRLFEESLGELDATHYEVAITKVKESMSLSGSSAPLFNLAQAYRLSGRKTEAIAAYRQYLAAFPMAPNVYEVRYRIRELGGPL